MTESQHDAADALIRTTKRLRACTTTIHERVHHAFTEHPHSQRMTYCEHFKRAAWTALRLARGAAALAVHAVFPFVLQTTGSDTVKTLHGELKEAAGLDMPEGHQKEHEAAEEPKEDIPEHEGPKEDIVQELIDGLEEPQEDSEESQESQEDSEESQQESQQDSQEESSGCESCDAHQQETQEELNEQALEEQEEVQEESSEESSEEFSKKSN
jgi:Mg-chelatase subunit ChlI